ncbi:MAG: gliding motility-associated C-terminal domain-containing protein [Bacteroidetes bacterium]|nr:MAG: gliding motility-associated C-terminal domain-containing protein [Bacteroidota bacterium]
MNRIFKIILFLAVFSVYFSNANAYILSNNNSTVFAGNDTSLVCQTDLQLNGSLLDFDEVGVWYVFSGTGTIINANQPNASVSGLVLGNTILVWRVENINTSVVTEDQLIIYNLPPTPALITTPNTITCNSLIGIAANVPITGTGIWSLESGAGSIAGLNSPITTIRGLGIGINIFKWTISGGGCSSNATVSINFNKAFAGINQTICGDNINFNAIPASVNSGVWSNVNTALPQIDDVFDSNSLVTDIQPGLNIFRWRTRNLPGGCISDSFVTITGNMVNQANADIDRIVCVDSLFLNGNIPIQGIGTWSILTSTSAIIVNNTVSNSKIKTLSAGNNVLEWKIKKGTCVSRDTVIIRNDSPSKAIAMSDVSICTNTLAITATAPTQGVGQWYTISGIGNIVNPNANNTSVTGLNGNLVLGWKTSFGSCPDRKDTLNISNNVFVQANAGLDKQICGDTTSLFANSVSGFGTWRVISGTGVVMNPSSYNSKVINISVNGVLALEWEYRTSLGCPLSKDTVLITRDFVTPSNAGLNRILCTNNTVLGANIPVFGTGAWSMVAGGGNITNPLLATSSITNLASGINIFRWTISSTYCSSSSTVSINFNQANAGSNQALCVNTVNLNANPASVNSGIWTLRSPITGNPLTEPQIDDDVNPTSSVTNIQPGRNVFRWTTRNISPNSCTSISEVTVTGDMINNANADIDRVVCVDSVFLNGNIPIQGIGTWSVLTSTSAIIVNSTVPNTKIRTLAEKNNVLEWKIQKGACISRDTVIIRNDSPSKALVVNDLSICTSNTTITAIAPTQGMGTWFSITGFGNIANPNASNTSVSGLSAGAITIGWRTSFAACPSKFDTLRITRFISIPANAGIDRQICGDSIILSGNSITGIGVWRILTGTGIVLNPSSYNSKVRNISVNGITRLEWEFQTPGCSFTRDTVDVLRDFVTPATILGGNQTRCINNAILIGNAPLLGLGSWSITGGGGSLSGINTPTITATGLLPNSNIFRWQISSAYCSSNVLVTITNNMPSPAISNVDKIICSTADTLKANAISQGSATWALLTGTGTILSPTSITSRVTNLGFGNNVFQITISKFSCLSRDTLILNNNLPDIAFTGNDTILCTDRMRVRANNPIQGQGTWVIYAGNLSISGINDPRATFTGIAKGLNQLIWSVTSGICQSQIDTIKVFNYSVEKPITSGNNCIILTTNTSAIVTLNSSVLNAGESATWAISPSGSYSFFPNSSNANITVGGVGRGFYRMVRDVFDSFGGTCRTKDTVLVSVIPRSNPGLDQCLRAGVGVTTMTSTLVSLNSLNNGLGENGFWSFETSINGNAPFPIVVSSTGLAQGMRKGVHVFAYNVRNTNAPTCISKENTRITVLTQAEAGNNQCIKDVAEQTPLIPNVGNPINQVVGGQLFWSAAGPAEINTATGVTNNLVVGRNRFYLTNFNINSNCSSTDSVFITLVTKPNAGLDTFLIANPANNFASSTLRANAPNTLVGESASWIIANESGNSSSPNAILGSFTLPVTSVQNLIPGVNSFVWQINNLANGCSFRDTVASNVLSQARVNPPFYVTNSNPSNPLSFTLSALNTSPASLRLNRGERGSWELVDFFAVNAPSSIPGVNPNTIQLSNVRRGVFNFRWTISNISFSGFVSTANISITVLTKAKAGNPYCINSINNLDLGNNSPTIPIRQLSAEKYFWTCNDANVNINQIDTLLQNSTDNQPIAAISNIPIGKTKMYLHIKNTRSGFEDVDSVQITKITKADIGSDQELCVNTAQMAAINTPNSIVGESFSWNRISGKGTFLGNNLNPIIIGLDTGKNVFSFEIENTGCKNVDTINVSNIGPYLVTVGGVPISCFTTNYFDGNDPKRQFPTATGKWSLITQPGFSNALLVNDQVARLQVNDMIRVGAYKFIYTISNKFCSITSDTLTSQRQNSIFGNAGPNANICTDKYIMQGSYPSIAGVSGEWSLNAGGGVISNINDKNATITGIPNDEVGFQNIFLWKVTLGECSSTYNVVITSYSPPTTASILGQNIVSRCENDTIYLNSFKNVGLFIGTPSWRNIQGNLLYDSPSAKQTLTTFSGFGTFKSVYEITNSVYCPVSRDTITINRYKRPLLSSAGINQRICADTIPLNAQIPEVGGGIWSITTASSAIILNNNTSPVNKISNVQPGEYKFKWKVINGTCLDSSFVNYSVRSQITKPIASNIPTQCDTLTVAISGNQPVLGTNVWRGPYLMNGTTVSNILAPNSRIQDSLARNTNLYLKDIGKTALLYVIKDDFCVRFDTVFIESIHLPSRISIVKDTVICGDSILIKVKEPQFGLSKWNISTINGINILQQTNTSLGLAMLPYGVTTFIYSIEQPVCVSKFQVVTVANYKLENAFAGNDTLICNPTLILKANNPRFGSGQWNIISGSATFADNSLPNTEVTNLSKGQNVLKWTISNNQCSSIIDLVTITNNKPQTPTPFAEEIKTFTPNTTIEAPIPTFGIGTWSVFKSSAVIENPTSNIASIKNLDVGENIFRWTISTLGCNPEFADIKVVLNDIIIPVLISPNNDDINDVFDIKGLDKYPNSKLEVFNRWGKSVYFNSNYDNSWKGTNSDSQPLADDTYIFMLSSNNGNLIKKDFVTIKR